MGSFPREEGISIIVQTRKDKEVRQQVLVSLSLQMSVRRRKKEVIFVL